MRYTFLIAIIFLFTQCSKDSNSSAPVLKYESVNSKEIPRGGSLIFRLNFKDKEGDLSAEDSSLYFEKVSINCSTQLPATKYKLPEFPTSKNQQGIIEVAFTNGIIDGPYQIITPSCDIDTCFFRFVLEDKAKNKSDTINTETIVLIE